MKPNARAIYVNAAMAAIEMAKTEQDLIDWWKGEKPNRDLLNLSPHQWPGLDLLDSFKARRIQLKQKALT